MSPKNQDWLAGFLACLDLLKHHSANAETVADIMEIYQSVEVAVKDKHVEQLLKELMIF